MARGTTRGEILTDLRNELRQSANPALAQGSRDYHLRVITRTQKRLWMDYEWPHMQIERDKRLQAGSRYYDFPSEIDFNRVQDVHVKWSGNWLPVKYGIGPAQYNAHDPEEDERTDPVVRWHIHEAGQLQSQFEVWPLPGINGDTEGGKEGWVRFKGIRYLGEFNSDDDRADLDDDLIVLYSAAEILAAKGSDDAGLRLEEANNLYARLRGGQSKQMVYQLGALAEDGEVPGTSTDGDSRIHVVVGQSVY